MLGWIVAFILFICLVVYIYHEYKTKGKVNLKIQKLARENTQLGRKNQGLQEHFKAVKRTSEYKSNKRLEDLENYIEQNIRNNGPDTIFAATFEAVGVDSIENSLHKMRKRADTEILIVSPWIKEGAWIRIKPRIRDFINSGGEFNVFLKGEEKDFFAGNQ